MSVLFTDSECLVLSPEFKLPDENQVLLKIPRQNNMYSFNLENIVPTGGLACLIAKATTDESNKWHRRLGHVNFKNLNKLVKGNLVRGLPSKIFQNDHTCVACQKGKQHKASCKAKTVSSISHSLQLLHMDLFGPKSVRKFKNKEVIEFCGIKGIKREYSNARTPQQNGVAERKNMTLIEAARTMLADSFLPNTFWAEAVSTACYVLNRVLVTKPHNKTPYELLTSKAFRDKFRRKTQRVKENLTSLLEKPKPNVAGKGTNLVFDLDYLNEFYELSSCLFRDQLTYMQTAFVFCHSAFLFFNKYSTARGQTDDKRQVQSEEEQVFSIPLNTEGLSLADLTHSEEDDSEIPPLEDIYQNSTDGKGYYYDEVLLPVARLEAKRIFLAFASIYGLLFSLSNGCKKRLSFMGKVNERAWYATLSTFLLKNGYRRGTIDKTLFLKKDKIDIILVQVYVDDIIFGSTNKFWCGWFEALMKSRFQMCQLVPKGQTQTGSLVSSPLTWNPTQIMIMLEQILTGNPQQEVVNFLAGDSFLGNARSRPLWLLPLQRQNMLLLQAAMGKFCGFKIKFSTASAKLISSDNCIKVRSGQVLYALKMGKNTDEGTNPNIYLHDDPYSKKNVVLDYCPSINLVAITWKKSGGNVEFHEFHLISVLEVQFIHCSTVQSLVSTTFVEQFWMSAKSKTINNVRHITANVAGKSVSILRHSIRNKWASACTIPKSFTLLLTIQLLSPETFWCESWRSSSSDKSLSGNEGDMTIQGVYDLCLSLCKQCLIEAKIPKKDFQKRGCTQRVWVSHQWHLRRRKGGRKFAKGESSVQRDPLFDEMPEDTIDHMETENAQSEGRTREMVDEDKEIDERILSTEDVLSTDKEGVSTDFEKVSTDRPIVSTDGSRAHLFFLVQPGKLKNTNESTEDEEQREGTEEKVESTDGQVKGTEDQTEEEIDTQTSTQHLPLLDIGMMKQEQKDRLGLLHKSLLTIKASSKIDQKTRKRRLKRRMNLQVELIGITQDEKKFLSNLKARIEADASCMKKLQEQEREQFTIEERAKFLHDTIAAQRKFLAQQRSEAIRNKPPTKNQLRNQMMTYLKHVGNYKHSELKIKKFEEIQALYEKIKSEVIKEESKEEVKEEDKDEESTRKRKLGTRKKMKSRKRRYIQYTSEDDSEKEIDELRLYLTIAQDEEKEVDYEILDRKYPIKEWKTECLGTKPQTDQAEHLEEINLNVVIRSNGQKRYFSTLMTVLSIFDREDLNVVYQLVMEKYQDEMPEGFDRVLWGDLMVLFNSDDKDEFWSSQLDWIIVSWKLHSSSGVHTLVTDTGLVIHMLVEKKYPLRKEVLMQMLKLKLESEEENTMALELIKFVKKILGELESEE
ncbi:putative ribonuclease H-like domain-containing protein [Tanacetum coccineum]